MRAMKNRDVVLSLFLSGVIAFFLYSCSISPDIVDGSTEVVIAQVFERNADERLVTAKGATVRIISNQFDPDINPVIIREYIADVNGYVRIPVDTIGGYDSEKIMKGKFNILAENNSFKKFERLAITPSDFDATIVNPDHISSTIILEKTAEFNGVIEIKDSNNLKNTYIVLLGSVYDQLYTETNGKIRISDFAEGEYDIELRYVKKENLQTTTFDTLVFPTRHTIKHNDTSTLRFSIETDGILIDDCEGKSDLNNFSAFWFVYDDSSKTPYYKDFDNWIPNGEDGYWKDSLDGGGSYIFNDVKTINESGEHVYDQLLMTNMSNEGGNEHGTPGYAAKVSFYMDSIGLPLSTDSSIDSTYGNYIGIGTGIVNESEKNNLPINLETATKITYYAKASVAMDISFKVVTDQGNFQFYSSYYEIVHSIGTDWKKYIVYLKEKDFADPSDTMSLTQPDWVFRDSVYFHHPKDVDPTVNSGVLPFDVGKIVELEWVIVAHDDKYNDKYDINKHLMGKEAALYIDDVEISYTDMKLNVK